MRIEDYKVKEYYRKNRQGGKTPYRQILLKSSTVFNKDDEIAVISCNDLNELLELYNNNNNSILEDEVNRLEKEKQVLKKQYDELEKNSEKKIKKLNMELDILSDDKKTLTDTIAGYKKTISGLNKEIKDLHQQQRQELKELNTKLNNEKDFNKALLIAINDLNHRNIIERLTNKKPATLQQVLQLKAGNDISGTKK